MFEQLKNSLKRSAKEGRSNVMKYVTAWGLFGAIIIVFIFWGLTPHNQSVGQGGAAAVVNDNTISLAKYSEAVERLRRDPRFEQIQGLGGDQARQFIASQAISQLIELELLRQATDEARIWTSDAEVAQVIYDIPDFKENGKFSSERYRGLLAANRKSPADFESDLRTQQSVRRVYEMFTTALKPMPLEIEKQKSLAAMKANLEFLSLPIDGVVPPDRIPAGDVKSFFANAENDTKVKENFESHKAEFATPEEVKVRHILIAAKEGDSTADAAALKKAQDLYARAKKEDFGKLASQNSDDPGSKSKGGVIDFFARGKMVPEFEEIAFKAPKGEISEPIKTQFGYHLIQVLERKPATEPNLEAARESIARKMLAQERSKAAVAALEEALKKGDAAAIQKFANDHKLKWTETGTFSIDSENVPKLGPNEEVVRSAFTLNASRPLHPALVRQGPTAFVLRYKPVAVTKDDPNSRDVMMQEMIAGRRSEDAVRKWMDGLRKGAKISTNDQILRR